MTPEQWFAESNPDKLLAFIDPPPVLVGNSWQYSLPRPPAANRRLRLFAVACARMVWDFLPTDARSAVLISERFAEGRASVTDLYASRVSSSGSYITFQQQAVHAAGHASLFAYGSVNAAEIDTRWNPQAAARSAAWALATAAAGRAPQAASHASHPWHHTWNQTFLAARVMQAAIFRDIFPPPGYTPRLDSDWLTSTVVAIVRQMDESNDFSATPILADALQDAGCGDETVLQCCRAPGNVHVRGNWVADLVLGRA